MFELQVINFKSEKIQFLTLIIQRGLARYRSRSPNRARESAYVDEAEVEMERRIRNQVSKQIREEMEAEFRDILQKEMKHGRREPEVLEDPDRFLNHSQIREDIKEEVRREMREEMTMRELGRNLPPAAAAPAASLAPLTPPKLNTSPSRYRTVLHSPAPAPSPPTLYASPSHSSTHSRTLSPTKSGVPVAAPDYSSSWRHKSPNRRTTLEEVERDLEQLRQKQRQYQQQQPLYQPHPTSTSPTHHSPSPSLSPYAHHRQSYPAQRGSPSPNPFSLTHSPSPYYGISPPIFFIFSC